MEIKTKKKYMVNIPKNSTRTQAKNLIDTKFMVFPHSFSEANNLFCNLIAYSTLRSKKIYSRGFKSLIQTSVFKSSIESTSRKRINLQPLPLFPFFKKENILLYSKCFHSNSFFVLEEIVESISLKFNFSAPYFMVEKRKLHEDLLRFLSESLHIHHYNFILKNYPNHLEFYYEKKEASETQSKNNLVSEVRKTVALKGDTSLDLSKRNTLINTTNKSERLSHRGINDENGQSCSEYKIGGTGEELRFIGKKWHPRFPLDSIEIANFNSFVKKGTDGENTFLLKNESEEKKEVIKTDEEIPCWNYVFSLKDMLNETCSNYRCRLCRFQGKLLKSVPKDAGLEKEVRDIFKNASIVRERDYKTKRIEIENILGEELTNKIVGQEEENKKEEMYVKLVKEKEGHKHKGTVLKGIKRIFASLKKEKMEKTTMIDFLARKLKGSFEKKEIRKIVDIMICEKELKVFMFNGEEIILRPDFKQ